jgi:predicted DNA-binding protein
MQTLSFQAPDKMSKALAKYAKQLKLSKAHLLRQGLEHYLDDLEDVLAYQKAKAENRAGRTYTLEEVSKKLNLD